MRHIALAVSAALFAVLLLRPGAPAVHAQVARPSRGLDLTTFQTRNDGSTQPLPDVNVLLADTLGHQVALAKTDANGFAHIDAQPGNYSVTAYRDGYAAAGKLVCGEPQWDQSADITWGSYAAVQIIGVDFQPGRLLCQQYLFAALPAPSAPPSHPVYLTVDDGYLYLCQTVDLVHQLGIHVTFFLTGQAILANPDCVRRLIADGNELGNHSFAHEDLTRLSRGQIMATLQRTEDAAQAVAGVTTRPLCRPAYGAVNATVRQAAADWGCSMILWDRDTRDWAGTSPSFIEDQALSVRCTGEIVLMHTQAFPREQVALPYIVDSLHANGCEPAALPTGP
jgi:peptidoglycan/xylan/chitin deacetylase (PgdA/CDA1 family)